MELLPGDSDIISFHHEFKIQSEVPLLCRPNCEVEKREFLDALKRTKEGRKSSKRKSFARLSLTDMPPPPPLPVRLIEETRTIDLNVNLSAAEMIIAILRNGKVDSFDLKGIIFLISVLHILLHSLPELMYVMFRFTARSHHCC